MSNRDKKYLKMLRDHNTGNLTWRQFYVNLYGECHWMGTTHYGGEWLDKIMGE
jgi:hypothetical protein